ncbi:MAG: protein of unknown function DUF3718 [Idiomarinaceae bacterium HL-53]|nr:MAG: protein of unknown function DUF3718 [Idiomarinaceae bacterium HL-53]CUS48255.1 Protein of unknown function (DUF3718) [Idiomarinaceae bacterium HL-53]
MKNLFVVVTAAFIGMMSVQSTVQASNAIAESVCSAISADDRQRLRTILDNHNVRVRNIYDGVRCNGFSMIQFAITAEAAAVGEFLVRQLPARAIEEDTVNGVSVLDWAEQSGYGDSAVLTIVRDRIAS